MKTMMIALLLATFTRTALAAHDSVRALQPEIERTNSTIEERTDDQV